MTITRRKKFNPANRKQAAERVVSPEERIRGLKRHLDALHKNGRTDENVEQKLRKAQEELARTGKVAVLS